MPVTLSVGPNKVQVQGVLTSTPAGLAAIPDSNGFTWTGPTLTSGTAAGQADRRLIESLSIPAAGNVTVSLSSWVDTFGATDAFLRIKGIFVELLASPAAVSVLVGGAATNAWATWCVPATAQIRVRNSTTGGVFYLDCGGDGIGYTVTATTADQLKFVNEDATNAAAINLWLHGCSA